MKQTIAQLKKAGRVAAVNELIPYARTLGLESFEDEGEMITVLRRRETNIGNTVFRAVHGGVIGTLLEHAAIMKLFAETPVAVVPKTVNVSIDYLRPAQDTDTFARGVVIRQGRRIANVRVEAWQDDPEKPVAAAHAHFRLA